MYGLPLPPPAASAISWLINKLICTVNLLLCIATFSSDNYFATLLILYIYVRYCRDFGSRQYRRVTVIIHRNNDAVHIQSR